jgi:hypothetical protein
LPALLPARRISVTLNFEVTRSLNGGAPVNVGSLQHFQPVLSGGGNVGF